MALDYECLAVHIDRGVAFVTIDHPPINLLDEVLLRELDMLGEELETDDDVRAVVFQSADPDFFIAHADVAMIQQLPKEVPPEGTIPEWHRILERFRTMPKATIGKIEGRAGGGGSEFLLALDMRFGAIGRVILSQREVALGLVPGGGATQRLPRLVGRSRALEIILGCQTVSAELAERYGYINRAFPPEELTPFVEELAYRIASFPAEAIARAKAAVDAAELPLEEGLAKEAHYLYQSLAMEEVQNRLSEFMERGLQTREMELAR